MTTSAPFVPPLDAEREAFARMPSYLRGGLTRQVTEALIRPLCEIDAGLTDVALGLDPTNAEGEQLAGIGALYGIANPGIPESEFRRLVLAAAAATSSGARLPAGILAAWTAIAGPGAADVRVGRIPSTNCVRCFATVTALPSQPFAVVAGQVLARAVAEGVEVYGVLSLADAIALDPAPTLWGLDTGTLSMFIGG